MPAQRANLVLSMHFYNAIYFRPEVELHQHREFMFCWLCTSVVLYLYIAVALHVLLRSMAIAHA